MHGSGFKFIINIITMTVSKLLIVELTIGDSYWIETFTINPYYRGTHYRNASIFRCIHPYLELYLCTRRSINSIARSHNSRQTVLL